jgi:hypothetical protein
VSITQSLITATTNETISTTPSTNIVTLIEENTTETSTQQPIISTESSTAGIG